MSLCMCAMCAGVQTQTKKVSNTLEVRVREVYEPAGTAIENSRLLEEPLIAELSLQPHIKIFYRF